MPSSRFIGKDPLAYHANPSPGKIRILPSKPLNGPEDLALAYTPGVARACEAIALDPQKASEYTIRQRLVAVITNGTAVLGLGNIGPLASKPVMEGKAVLFQKFAHLNAIDVEISELDPQKLVDIIASLEPTFGAINLEDIKAPECFYVEDALKNRLNIPVFHDDQHGTAVVVAAVLLNALRVVDKKWADVRCVVSGAGAAALSCLTLLKHLGLRLENILVVDSMGVLHIDRLDLSQHKQVYAHTTLHRSLADAIKGADIFLGVSQKGVLTPHMVKTMAPNPIILALANPDPEITPAEVYAVRPEALVGTGRSDYPNQVNNVLCFPYIFRGALDVKARQITEPMKVACAEALSELAREGFADIQGYYGGKLCSFGADYFLPYLFDVRLLERLPAAVAKAALSSGASSMTDFCLATYQDALRWEAYEAFPALRTLLSRKTSLVELPTLVYALHPENAFEPHTLNGKMIAAARALEWYGLVRPILVGDSQQRKTLSTICPKAASWEWLESHSFSPNFNQPSVLASPPPKDPGVSLKGCAVSGGALFWCASVSHTAFQPENRETILRQSLNSLQALSYTPVLVAPERILHQLSPEFKSFSCQTAVPFQIQDRHGYLWVPYDFPLAFPQEILELGGGGAMFTPLTLGYGSTTWQYAQERDTLPNLVESSAFALIQP